MNKKLYYHKTSGGAEYLCSSNVENTNEGSFDSQYVVRIDGDIKKDAELMVKETIIGQVKILPVHSTRWNQSHRVIANQYHIQTPEGLYFQSYDSIIAFIREDGKIFLDEKYWNYSSTTGKYRNDFLSEERKETEKKIKSGEYKLVNLN